MDRGESAEKGWSLVCNGAGLFCDEGLAARPGGGKRDVTGESPAGPGELRLRAQAPRAAAAGICRRAGLCRTVLLVPFWPSGVTGAFEPAEAPVTSRET